MVRSVDRGQATWAPVFAGTAVQGPDGRGAGCEVLAVSGDSVPRITGGAFASDWPGAEWRLLQRDPTSVSLRSILCINAGGGTGNVDARVVARLEDAALSLALSVHNDGGAAMPVAIGLRAFFPPGLVHGSRLLVVRAGDEPVPLRLPAGRDADGFVATSDRSKEKSLSPWDGTASGDASRLVMACDEGVHRVEVLRDDPAGHSALTFLGATVPLEPGACTGLAVSMECW